MAVPTDLPSELTAPTGRRFAMALGVALLLWGALVGGIGYLLYSRTYWLRDADEANLREWLDEARIYRKSLPELAAEYIDLHDREKLREGDDPVIQKRQEIAEQLKRLADPTRIYQGQIPLFPDIYRLVLQFPGMDWPAIDWISPLPRPRPQLKATNELTYHVLGESEPRAVLTCEYRLHAFNLRQRETEEAQHRFAWVVCLAAAAGLPAFLWVYLAFKREQAHEEARLAAQSRAAAAEKAALELRSQFFANIGIMAGSYAHNIKNLLIRPNDLLVRCAEADGVGTAQKTMLGDIRNTLTTVTERLQEILQTIRHDPTQAKPAVLNVNSLMERLSNTWTDLARDRWKLTLSTELANGPVFVKGDQSHLIQMLENLLFNARDATFEMRNVLREQARAAADDIERQKSLLNSAAWRGEVVLRTRSRHDAAILEVVDNGIGMSEEVRQRCTETHFSTKRENALFEGLSAGMGLGLSFVIMVLEHHRAILEIDSAPRKGATFRVIIPNAGVGVRP
jgi:signal transduction histidine kinase